MNKVLAGGGDSPCQIKLSSWKTSKKALTLSSDNVNLERWALKWSIILLTQHKSKMNNLKYDKMFKLNIKQKLMY